MGKLIAICTVIISIFMVFVSCTAPAAQPAKPATPVAEKKVLKVGVMGPLKFVHGRHDKAGAELAAEEINAAGGIKAGNVTYTIQLAVTDTNEFSSIPDAVSTFEKLIAVEKVNFVMGGARSEATLAQQEVMADNKIIYLALAVSSDELSKRVKDNYDRYKYFFRFWSPTGFYYQHECFATLPPVIDKVRQELGIQKPKIALFMEKQLFVDPHIPYCEKIIPQLGCEIAVVWRPAPTATDVAPELAAMKDAGASIIYRIDNGVAGATLGKQWAELQMPMATAGGSSIAMTKDYWEASGGKGKYIGNYMYLARVEMIKDVTIPYWDKIMQRIGEPPNAHTMSAYMNLYILKDAIERVGTIDTNTLIPALENTDYKTIVGRIKLNPLTSNLPHDVIWGPGYATGVAYQWMTGNASDWSVYWPDGKELPQAMIDAGAPAGWKGIKFPGTVDYQLPPWMTEYWKSKK